MGTIAPTAPLDAAAVLPDALIDQYVKPDGDQAMLVAAFRQTALDWVERHTARSLQRRAWAATFDGFDDRMWLPRQPVRSISLVSYVDQDGTTVDAAGLWRLAGDGLARAFSVRWPTATSVLVTFEAGYDDLATEAPALRIAALLMTKHLFDGGSVDDVPATVTLLLDAQFRTPVIG